MNDAKLFDLIHAAELYKEHAEVLIVSPAECGPSGNGVNEKERI
jgi:hypothetical protein